MKKEISDDQVTYLSEALDRDTPVFILIDSDTSKNDREKILHKLSLSFNTVKSIIFHPKKGEKIDPGGLDHRQVEAIRLLIKGNIGAQHYLF
jgi:hypothetical protein